MDVTVTVEFFFFFFFFLGGGGGGGGWAAETGTGNEEFEEIGTNC